MLALNLATMNLKCGNLLISMFFKVFTSGVTCLTKCAVLLSDKRRQPGEGF